MLNQISISINLSLFKFEGKNQRIFLKKKRRSMINGYVETLQEIDVDLKAMFIAVTFMFISV